MLKHRSRTDPLAHNFSAGISFRPISALRDIFAGLAKWRIWVALSWNEFKSTYHRSYFGIIWILLSFAGFLFVKIAIFSSLLNIGEPGYYDSYLVLGFLIWFYLSSSFSSAPDTFVANQSWIKSEPLPFSVYVYKSVLREFYSFFLTSLAAIAAILYVGYPIEYASIGYSLLSIGFLLINACAVKLLLGTISSRFRDISHLVKAIMLPMMFLSPVFWMPSQMEPLMPYLWWNPFFHYLEIFRAPLLDQTVPVESWTFVGLLFAGVVSFGFLLFARYRQRIIFWL